MYKKTLPLLICIFSFGLLNAADFTYETYLKSIPEAKKKGHVGYIEWIPDNIGYHDAVIRDQVRKVIFNDILAHAGQKGKKVSPVITNHRQTIRKNDDFKTYYSDPEAKLLKILSALGIKSTFNDFWSWIDEARKIQGKLDVTFNGKDATKDDKANHWAIVYQALCVDSIKAVNKNKKHVDFIEGNLIEAEKVTTGDQKETFDFVEPAFKRIDSQAVAYAALDGKNNNAEYQNFNYRLQWDHEEIKENAHKAREEKASQNLDELLGKIKSQKVGSGWEEKILGAVKDEDKQKIALKVYMALSDAKKDADDFNTKVVAWFNKPENNNDNGSIVDYTNRVIEQMGQLYIKHTDQFDDVLQKLGSLYTHLDCKDYKKFTSRQKVSDFLKLFVSALDKGNDSYDALWQMLNRFVSYKKYYGEEKISEFSLGNIGGLKAPDLSAERLKHISKAIYDIMESHQGIISHYAVDLLIVFMTSYSDTFIKDLKEVTQYDDDFSELMKKAKQLSDDLQLKDDGEKYKQDLEGYRKKIPEIKEKAFIETASKKLYDFRKKKLLVWKDDFGDKTYKYQKAEGIPSTQLKSDIVHSGLMKTIIAAFDEKDYLKSFFEERNHDDRKKFFQNFVNQAAQVDDLIIENIHLTMKQAINDINAHQWDKMMGVNKEGKEINIGHGYKKEMLDYVEVLKADLKKLFDDIKDDFKKDGIFAAKKD